MADIVAGLRNAAAFTWRLTARVLRLLWRVFGWPLRVWWRRMVRARWPGRIGLGAAGLLVAGMVWLAVAIPWPAYLLTPPFRAVAYGEIHDLQYLRPEVRSERSSTDPSDCRAATAKQAGTQALCADAGTLAARSADLCALTNAACKAIEARCAQNGADALCRDGHKRCDALRQACTTVAAPVDCRMTEKAGCGEPTWQGWTASERTRYYYYPQGSAQVMLAEMRYAWFVNLEMPFGGGRFATPENLARYGFLTDPHQKPDPNWNPGNLPVGFTKYYDTRVAAELLDFTCALCHTGELHYKGTAIRVLGGQAMHAISNVKPGQFQSGLMAAMLATYLNPFKFDRFAHGVIDPSLTGGTAQDFDFAAAKSKLHAEFGATIRKLLANAWTDLRTGSYPVFEGYGRTDATQRIANTVFGRHIADSNYRPALAPVNYPHLWDISKFNWVQWEGYAPQPMARNVNESLGVGARLDLFDEFGAPLPEQLRYQTSIQPDLLEQVEHTLAKLKAPSWPEHLFGAIDLDKARRGRALFDVNCRGCHGPYAVPATPPVQAGRRVPADTRAHVQGLQWTIENPPLAPRCYFPNAGVQGTAEIAEKDRNYLTPLQCLNLQDPQRVADADGHLQYTIDENGAVVGTACDPHSDNRAECGDDTRQGGEVPRHGAGDQNGSSATLERRTDAGLVCDHDGRNCALREWRMTLIPLREIGTDRTAAMEFAYSKPYDASSLGWTPAALRDLCLSEEIVKDIDPRHVSAVVGLNIMSLAISRTYFRRHPPSSPAQLMKFMGFGIMDFPVQDPDALLQYKSRPLHGIWATPPFLHNGSVRTIYQMLSPRSERETTFWSGTKEYDPVEMGYRNLPVPGAVKLDTRERGNDNTGHEFNDGCQKNGVIGHYLPPEDRRAIMEYLKVMDYTQADRADEYEPALLCPEANGKDECEATITRLKADETNKHPHYGSTGFRRSGYEPHCGDDADLYAPDSTPPQNLESEDRSSPTWSSWGMAALNQCSTYRELLKSENDTSAN